MTYYVVIDGLDYCTNEEIEGVLALLQSFLEIPRLQESLKVLFFVRPDLHSRIVTSFPKIVSLQISPSTVDRDIRTFIEVALLDKVDMGLIKFENGSLIPLICQYIIEGADGM